MFLDEKSKLDESVHKTFHVSTFTDFGSSRNFCPNLSLFALGKSCFNWHL